MKKTYKQPTADYEQFMSEGIMLPGSPVNGDMDPQKQTIP